MVNEFRLVNIFWRCPRPPRLTDRIDLNNNAVNDNAVVLLDGRRGSGCVNDELWRGSDIINVGSVLSSGTCNFEVAVFSDNDAMLLITPVTIWTNSLDDSLPVNLTPNLLQAPVTLWLAMAGTLVRAQGDIANANLLYNLNHVGVGFNANYQNVSGNAMAVTTIGTGCANVAAVQASAFYTPNQLNVYYVNSAFTGMNCGANRNIQYVGTTANNQTLAHEFGHSFSLIPSNAGGHTNGLPGFGTNNVMWGGGAGRTHFSEGQAFRMNVSNNSTLNTNGVRVGPTRYCPPLITSSICPALALDGVPN